ncbi:hypothetical protein PMG11_00309 [Penicillium brasilianum]|uniref:NAD-dependent epimerase/dehydratase domain-containing protein n=1 Tax=Penicillium brasilianum TaxID=104259 RepID=A0A0F7TG89_PENBI|nr:hypothetical protein PMG11_00309 [Penicillium brasilianum]
MPKVLILGATGYLGRQIANLLVQSGQHTVYGVTRTTAKAKQMAREEIIPMVCADPINQPDPYLEIIRSKHIDVVVDVAGADAGSHKFLADVVSVGKERNYESLTRHMPCSKIGYIYCSGTWVHGSSNEPVNDLDIVGQGANTPPEELVAWRVGMEQAVLRAKDVLDVMVLRPALIYGRESTIWASYITPVLEAATKTTKTVEIPLDADSRPGLIHVDDTAKAFVQAIEKVHLFPGTGVYPVFDLVTSQESMRDIFNALASTWGFTGTVELKGHGGDLFSKAMSTSFRGSSARAKQLLGWQPSRLKGFVQDMDIYAAAFVAEHID